MTYVWTILGLAVAGGAIATLCSIFGVDFGLALRAHWRHGFTRGRGLWAVLGFVAMVALAVDLEASAIILEFVCPPGRFAEVQRMMPRAYGVFVGAAAFMLAANVVVQAALGKESRPSRRPETDEEYE